MIQPRARVSSPASSAPRGPRLQSLFSGLHYGNRFAVCVGHGAAPLFRRKRKFNEGFRGGCIGGAQAEVRRLESLRYLKSSSPPQYTLTQPSLGQGTFRDRVPAVLGRLRQRDANDPDVISGGLGLEPPLKRDRKWLAKAAETLTSLLPTVLPGPGPRAEDISYW